MSNSRLTQFFNVGVNGLCGGMRGPVFGAAGADCFLAFAQHGSPEQDAAIGGTQPERGFSDAVPPDSPVSPKLSCLQSETHRSQSATLLFEERVG